MAGRVRQGFGADAGADFAGVEAKLGFFKASASTRPSRGAKVIPHSDASVGAMSAGVTAP